MQAGVRALAMLLLASPVAAVGNGNVPAVAVAPKAVEEPETLHVTGLPALVEYPSTLGSMLKRDVAPVCIEFVLRSFTQSPSAVRLTTTGLGATRLLDLGVNAPVPACDSRVSGAAYSIDLQAADRDQVVRLILPASAFPQLASGASGKLLLIRADKPATEVALTLRREEHPPFLRALLWFFGIAIPASFTAFIGLLVYRSQKSADVDAIEKETLIGFRNANAPALAGFFTGLYDVTVKLEQDDQYGAVMERELSERRIIYALPGKARERLLTALRRRNRKRVGEELAKAFPDYKKAILDAHP